MEKWNKICIFVKQIIMVTEEQLVMEAIVYGGLSIVLVCVMIWMVIDEKRKYDRSYGRKKK